jgi:hypothetical protein
MAGLHAGCFVAASVCALGVLGAFALPGSSTATTAGEFRIRAGLAVDLFNPPFRSTVTGLGCAAGAGDGCPSGWLR